HAEAETGTSLIRHWSKHVCGRLQDLLATLLNVEVDLPPGSKVEVFLDDRVLSSGAPLTETLRYKAQHSAVLLVLMSPLYPQKSWCIDELEWFFEQADKDGRDQHHCTVLHIQKLPDSAWPRRLRDLKGEPVLSRKLLDQRTELPIGLTDLNNPHLEDA